MKPEEIRYITIHCSASRPDQDHSLEDIDAMHKARGWKGIGYHWYITRSGAIFRGRPEDETGAGVYGYNRNNIHICYEGGLDQDGNPADTRTPQQKEAMRLLLAKKVRECRSANIKGHRDFSPDADGDGIIEPWEWIKACPCFDAQEEYPHAWIHEMRATG